MFHHYQLKQHFGKTLNLLIMVLLKNNKKQKIWKRMLKLFLMLEVQVVLILD